MANTKRSKRHRTQRNHISVKDSVICIQAFAQYAQEIRRNEKAKYVPRVISTEL